MRIQLLAILLFAFCLQLSAATLGQSITLSEKNASLQTVLNKIEHQSGYDVFLQTELLAKSAKVSVKAKNQTLQQVLDKIFKEQPLSYAIVGHTIVLKEKTAKNQLGNSIAVEDIITGRVQDSQTKEPLVGATVVVKGTQNSNSTALDGSFKLKAESSNITISISYIGYVTKEVETNGNNKLGIIYLVPNSASLKEVAVTANPSQKINRQTPIAASSINEQYIEEKGAGAEFPELLRMTPGVTVSRGGGGYGDSRINIRGFASNNVALLINGIPVNDVEAGKIYWNDWAGLEDVTTSMQVQRGLGASIIAVPSLGGTIDITTRSTSKEASGTLSQSIGSYNQQKTLISYSTGLSNDGWASSFLLSKSSGNSPSAEGLTYTGYNYFANVSKLIGTNQTLSFNIMGASQRHDQRYTYNTISTYRNAPSGFRYNSDWGYLNGQEYSAEQNSYSKPLASVNYNWNIDKNTSWSTVLYATYGTGNADYLTSNKSGVSVVLAPGAANEVPRTGGIYSPIDFNAITKNNQAVTDGSANMYMQDVENDHKQYGAITTLKKKVGDNLHFLGGLDLRYYEGEHFNKVANLFGASYVQDTRNNSATSPSGNINNPNAHATDGQKFNNDYTYDVASEGVYLQGEYTKKDLSVVITLSGSNTSNRRIDYFNYLPTDPSHKTDWINFLGYQAKGGLNYNLDYQNNIYGNIGYVQRAPLVASLFLNKDNTINKNAIAEKLFDAEIGYGYTSALFSANVNAYRSVYLDRSKVVVSPTANPDGTFNTANISGLNELHEGVEVEAKLRPIKDVVLGGMLSIGNYHYLSNTGATQITSDNGTSTTISALQLKGLKIGEPGTGATSAQTTAGVTLDIKVLPKVTIGGDYLYYGKYYASYDPSKITFSGYLPYQIPNFSTVNLNVVFRFKMAGFDASFTGNVYNLFNTGYIGDAFDTAPAQGASYITRTSQLGVDYGPGRFYMTTLKLKF
ncbi:TonB-dependent receptor domain-containing protein [Mucilaginibacter sp.]|uniref:TonB-dependent receptor domain-containing protein n=1 Tax=Mucilaginibacter sp. TaxID=1882438 RepID=UPI003D09B702